MKLEQMPRYPLLCGFTPLQRMENLEQALGCGPLYIKRDDLTPLGLGGNKTRKLEFLLGDALAGGADTLVTVGGVQTNHGRLTARRGSEGGPCLHAGPGRRAAGKALRQSAAGLPAGRVAGVHGQTEHIGGHRGNAGCAAGRRQGALFHPGGRQQRRGQRRVPCHGARAAGTGGQPAGSPARLVCTMGSLGTFAGLWLGARSPRRVVFRHGRGGEPHNRIHEGKCRGAGE